MGIFSRRKRTSEPPQEAVEETGPEEGGQHQAPAYTYGSGYPAMNYAGIPALHAESVNWRFAPHQETAVAVPTQPEGGNLDVVDTFKHASTPERLLLLIALALSTTAAYMSVSGMTILFPVEPVIIGIFGGLIEAVKFFGIAVIAAGGRLYGLLPRYIAYGLLGVAALINAAGVYGRLIEDHVGPAATRTAAFTERDADQGARIDSAAARLADLDRRIGQIDTAVDTATSRGRTRGAMNLADNERRNRASLAAERDRAQQDLAQLRAGRTGLAARHQENEAATTPIRYTAALFEDFGIIAKGTDPEKLIRWLAFMILISGDPLALALVFTINSRAKRRRG